MKAYLRSHLISKELNQRINNWYQHLYINKKIIRENEILQQLPIHLRTEIAVSVHLPTLSKVTIFQSCEKSLLEELVLKLTPQVRGETGEPATIRFNTQWLSGIYVSCRFEFNPVSLRSFLSKRIV